MKAQHYILVAFLVVSLGAIFYLAARHHLEVARDPSVSEVCVVATTVTLLHPSDPPRPPGWTVELANGRLVHLQVPSDPFVPRARVFLAERVSATGAVRGHRFLRYAEEGEECVL